MSNLSSYTSLGSKIFDQAVENQWVKQLQALKNIRHGSLWKIYQKENIYLYVSGSIWRNGTNIVVFKIRKAGIDAKSYSHVSGKYSGFFFLETHRDSKHCTCFCTQKELLVLQLFVKSAFLNGRLKKKFILSNIEKKNTKKT